MFHTVTAVAPRPIALPIAPATGPLTTRPTRVAAASTTTTTVSSSIAGRSFQIGRPSRISYIRFIARPNAPTYPDADQRAPARPSTSASPAPGLALSSYSVGARV